MSVDAPAGTVEDLAARLAAVDDVTLAALDPPERDRWLALARFVVDYIGDDDFHWGCTSAEVAEENADNAHDDGFERGFEEARERIVAGIEALVSRSMVEAELAVEVVPRIRAMTPWDNAEPKGSGERRAVVEATPVTSPSEQA